MPDNELKIVVPAAPVARINPFYIRLPHRQAIHVAVNALLDHAEGAVFTIKPVGDTASITVFDTRSQSLVEQVVEHFCGENHDPGYRSQGTRR